MDPLWQALSGTDQAKYLEQALSDAGLPVNMADLANFKTAIEVRKKLGHCCGCSLNDAPGVYKHGNVEALSRI